MTKEDYAMLTRKIRKDELPVRIFNILKRHSRSPIPRVIDVYKLEVVYNPNLNVPGFGLCHLRSFGSNSLTNVNRWLLNTGLPPLSQAKEVTETFDAVESGKLEIRSTFVNLLECLLLNFGKKHDTETLDEVVSLVTL